MQRKIAIVIPVYNHFKTLREVVTRTIQALGTINANKNYTSYTGQFFSSADIVVVDDGSTDSSFAQIADLPIQKLQHRLNQGKGAALLTAAQHLHTLGYSHMITLDADAQHFPEDIPLFIDAIKKNPYGFIIGSRDFSVENIPYSSRFGRKFSAFWMFVQTGYKVSDMQSGFRAYCIEALLCLSLKEVRYAFEVEALVKGAWSGFAIDEIPIQVYYQEGKERVSHFNKAKDNIRMTLLNTRLTVRALIPIPFKHYALEVENKKLSLLSPLKSLQILLKDSSALHLAYSATLAFFICLLPLLGLQSILLLLCINSLKLNRLCALLIIPLTWPPFMPALCILVGYRLINNVWLSEFSFQTLYHEFWLRFVDWIVGSLVLAPILGLCMGFSVYLLSLMLNAHVRKSENQ